MDINQDLKYAVLIDADNISNKYVKIILDEVANYGVATYRRIYGDWTEARLSSWKSVLLDYSISPIQQYSYTVGKNSTDSAMIIDAMDILYSGSVNGFCIISSDSDFTRLVVRLRESGMNVIGMGESKTPRPFIAACNQFKYLDILYNNARKAERRTRRKTSVKAVSSGVSSLNKDLSVGTGLMPIGQTGTLAVISNYAAGGRRRSAKDRDGLSEIARESGREYGKEVRDIKSVKDSKDIKGTASAKDNKDVKDIKDIGDVKDIGEARDAKDILEQKGMKESKDPKAAKDGKSAKGRKTAKDSGKTAPKSTMEQIMEVDDDYKDSDEAVGIELHDDELPEPKTKLETIIEAVEAIIEEGSDEDGWIFSANLGNTLAKRYPDFDVRNYGFTKLTPFIESLGVFEVKRMPAPGNSSVQHVYVRSNSDGED